MACPKPASSLHPRAPPANVPAGPESFFYGLPKATLDTHGPRPLCGLSEACLFSSPTGPGRKRSCRPQLGPESFFVWASEGDVRHPRAPPSNPPRQPAGLPRPLCGLSEACLFSSPTGPGRKRSCRPQLSPESFFYGLPKATLDTHGPRLQTLLGSRQACRGLSVACPKPASSLRPRAPPANVPAGRSLAQKAFSMGFRRQR